MTNSLLNRINRKPGFFSTMGKGYEHFEIPDHQVELNFIKGNKGEYLVLALLFGFAPLIWYGRKYNEDGISAEIKATNTYSRLHLDEESSKPSVWSA